MQLVKLAEHRLWGELQVNPKERKIPAPELRHLTIVPRGYDAQLRRFYALP